MKKRNLFFLFLSVFLFINISGCSKPSNKITKENNQVILTSFTVLADMIKNVAGDEFKVESITKIGMEVHGYQTTPGDLIRGSKATIFIDNGFGFELWAEKFLTNLDIKRITIADKITPILISEDAYKGKPNPHAWISPKRGGQYVDIIFDALSDIKPERKEYFKKNAAIYKNKINKIEKEFTLVINSLEENKKFLITCEGAFSYLAKDYGLKEGYLWPVNAESGVTPKRMVRVINTVKENKIPAVFCESTVSNESQLVVADETGAKFGGNLYVDSLSQEDGPASTYLNMLNHNLNLIKEGLNDNS